MKQIRSSLSHRVSRKIAAAALVASIPLPFAPSVEAASTYEPPVTVQAPKPDTFKAFRTRWMPSFDLKYKRGFEDDLVDVSIVLARTTPGTTFRIGRYSNSVWPKAELKYGFDSFSNITSVAFTAPIGWAASMLGSLTLNAGDPGKVKVTVSVTAKESNVVYEPWQSRYYEYVSAPSISWTDALAAADKRTFRGVTGHLAAVETERENEFIAANISQAANVWIAGTDRDNEGEFKWAAGNSSGTTFWKARCAANAPGSADSCTGSNSIVAGGQANGIYADGVADNPLVNTFAPWDSLTKEPNNWGGLNVQQGGENYVATNWDGTYGLWNDLPNQTRKISGYIVEYPNLPNKAFEGVIRRSVTHTITEDRSDFAPRNVKAVETTNPGEYRLTWDEPKAFSKFLVGIKAKKVFKGYAVASDKYIFERCGVKKGGSRTCLIRGFRPQVSPIFTVSAVYSKTPEFLKTTGQRTFGVGAKGTPSTVPDFVNLNLKDGYVITSASKITVAASGLAPSSAWSLKNSANGRTVMSGTTTSEGKIVSTSVTPPVTPALLSEVYSYKQLNLVLTYTKATGETVELPYSYQSRYVFLSEVWSGPKLSSGGSQIIDWPALVN